jgi:2-keto-3-deoxygluconate permease
MGAAIGTTAGVAATTPTAIAEADPSFKPQVETASAQIAAATIVTAILTPLLVAFLAKFSAKWNEKHGKN